MEDQKQTVRAAQRALDILICFTNATDLSLTEIAQRVSLHKSTVHRLLASLEEKDFLVRDPATERYRLGFRIWELSANLSQSDDPAVLLLPEMERLRDTASETVSLYIRDGKERIRIQAVQSGQAIRRVAPVGVRLPLYVGASGKVLIAFAEPEVREWFYRDPDWPVTIDRDSYMRQMETVRQQGYATSIEEREPGAAAIAAPVFNRSGKLAVALSVSGPASRFTLEEMRRSSVHLMESAQRMGKMLL